MKPFIEAYRHILDELIRNSSQEAEVTPKNVFQEGRPNNKPLIQRVVNELLLPGSTIEGFEHLVELYEHAQGGKTCLILMQHFSNFDIPNFYELLERRGTEGKRVADAIISIAGFKLNEENPIVRAFTEAYTRIVIFPSSSLKGEQDPHKLEELKSKRLALNMAAMWQIMRLKTKGHIILVFPTGTRYRPWQPETGRGLVEVYPYIKTFHYMVLIAINGNTLRINPNGKMDEDLVCKDIVIYTASPVYSCKEYRQRLIKEGKQHHHNKQFIVDQIMAELEAMHEATEKKRLELLKAQGAPDAY